MFTGGSETTVEWWTNGSVPLGADTYENETAFRQFQAPAQDATDRLANLLSAPSVQYAGEPTVNGNDVHVVSAPDVSAPATFDSVGLREVRNFSVTAWIDPHGLIRGWRVTQVGD